ncbi:GNAT family protein [Vibrio cholerae]|uniref:GNAT family N-acetyltransferase n=1 Tax=Vibrio cholerae TaxID=666 RepID=UPI001159AB34|nr:GNAT family protein [Vibrio cholerae]EGR0683803.1 N-acetyltransferase [Vibrio cholerae]TQQ69989.1 GNAT family N-acetyltransferase [Vibrio cholerae]HCJ7274067.1 GNAT family N-acetyltransferase [Vibrio cholerae]HCJ7281300.1 GNAT family N-acetyltransferase [Vibrio cholerae]HCJ7319064.1 GNAT family N-acetyltransferase [Vibrio cholerae]
MFTLHVDTDLKLALVCPKFAPHYLEIVNREREYLSQWLAWPPHANSEEFFLSFIHRSLHDYADGKSLVCGMIYKDKLVGNISFNSINHQLKKVEMGYWLSADYQGKGIVSRSVLKLIDVAFTDLDMEKVQISAATGNQPSRNVCERLGFVLEGTITRAENLNGRVVDHAVYGLSRTSWPET